MLLEANITKKDEHGGKVEKRYAVLTNKKFCYYYNENNYTDNSEPLASFFLKDIYQITILSRDQFDEKSFYLEIKVSSIKKVSQRKIETSLSVFQLQKRCQNGKLLLIS